MWTFGGRIGTLEGKNGLILPSKGSYEKILSFKGAIFVPLLRMKDKQFGFRMEMLAGR